MKSKVNFVPATAALLAVALVALGGCAGSEAAVGRGGLPAGSAAPQVADRDYDALFTDIGEAAFTQNRAERVAGEGGDYFRLSRIDVVDENGFDHQAIVVVCEGSEAYKEAYRTFVAGLVEHYGDTSGVIAGYRNAAAKGYRTYRDRDIDFFGMQEIAFTDHEGVERSGLVVAADGSDDYTRREAELYGDLIDAYIK